MTAGRGVQVCLSTSAGDCRHRLIARSVRESVAEPVGLDTVVFAKLAAPAGPDRLAA